MRKKVRGQPGFTLIEVLVVVAIIVILLAIGIPAVMGALDNARHNTDAKYERAAMALANGLLQTNSLPKGEGSASTTLQYLYDPESGKLVLRKSGSMDLTPYPPYGQCRKAEHNHTGKRLWVQVQTESGKIDLLWAEKLGGTTEPNWNTGLCDP